VGGDDVKKTMEGVTVRGEREQIIIEQDGDCAERRRVYLHPDQVELLIAWLREARDSRGTVSE
jgi:hypothetical protein